jgi:hypothetical protein
MKKFWLLVVVFYGVSSAAVVAADQEGDSVVRLSEPVAATADYEDFGAVLEATTPALSLSQAVSSADSHQGQPVLITTTVARVCQKKGCFFIAQEGSVAARITFKDYAFFIPTDSGRKRVTLLGTVSRQPLSTEQAQHLTDDIGGADADVQPGYENLIVAQAIRIPIAPGS